MLRSFGINSFIGGIPSFFFVILGCILGFFNFSLRFSLISLTEYLV